MKVVTLTSGGIDSCALNAYLCMSHDMEVYPVFFNYGQKSAFMESFMADQFLRHIGIDIAKNFPTILIENPELAIPMTGYGRMPLVTDADFQETKHRDWVPHRNLIFLTLAAQYASIIGAQALAIGSHKEELYPHPDSARSFLDVMETTLSMSDAKADEVDQWKILTPFVDRGWYKWDIVRWMWYHKLPIEYTYTCYQGGQKHCGLCRGCYDRQQAFKKSGMPDPTEYDVCLK